MIARETVVAAALRWRGTPYHHQASLKGIGCDCLGLVRGIWRELYGPEPENMPAYSRDWGDAAGVETLLGAAARHLTTIAPAAAQAGDVLAFRMRAGGIAKHAGVLIGTDRFLHAQEGLGVVEAALIPWWRRRIVAVFAFPGVA